MLACAAGRVAHADTPELVVLGGRGAPGATVRVAIVLSGDTASAGVSADADIRFSTDLLEFVEPVSAHCRVAARLAATHQLGGTLIEPGVLSLALFVGNLQVTALGDGELASCDFHILSEAGFGTVPLTLDFVGLGGARGAELAVVGVPGAIVIGSATPPCVGDCDGDASVTIDEIIRGVGIALDEFAASVCLPFDRNGDQQVSVPELVEGVKASLTGCPAAR